MAQLGAQAMHDLQRKEPSTWPSPRRHSNPSTGHSLVIPSGAGESPALGIRSSYEPARFTFLRLCSGQASAVVRYDGFPRSSAAPVGELALTNILPSQVIQPPPPHAPHCCTPAPPQLPNAAQPLQQTELIAVLPAPCHLIVRTMVDRDRRHHHLPVGRWNAHQTAPPDPRALPADYDLVAINDHPVHFVRLVPEGSDHHASRLQIPLGGRAARHSGTRQARWTPEHAGATRPHRPWLRSSLPLARVYYTRLRRVSMRRGAVQWGRVLSRRRKPWGQGE